MSYGPFAGPRLIATFGAGVDSPITIVAWVKRTAAQWASAGQGVIVDFNDNRTDADHRYTMICGSLADSIKGSSEATGSASVIHTFTDGQYDDLWVPIIAKYSEAAGVTVDRDIYIESTLETTNQSTDHTINSVLEITVGEWYEGSLQYAGLLAEIAIFDKALSDAEINALQTSAEAGPAPNTVASADCIAYWPLGTDQAMHTDQSGNGGPDLDEDGSPTFDADHPTITSAVTALQMQNYQGMNRLSGGFRE